MDMLSVHLMSSSPELALGCRRSSLLLGGARLLLGFPLVLPGRGGGKHLEKAVQPALGGAASSLVQLLDPVSDPLLGKSLLPAHVGHQGLLVWLLPLEVDL